MTLKNMDTETVLTHLFARYNPAIDWTEEEAEAHFLALLESGLDPNGQFGPNMTILGGANRPQVTARMIAAALEHGADPNQRVMEGRSNKYNFPIHRLSGGKHGLTVGTLMLAAGMDLNKPDSEGNTALHLAMGKGDRSFIEWLVLHGADDTLSNAKGQSVRDVAGSLYSRVFRPGSEPDPKDKDPDFIRAALDRAIQTRLDEVLPGTTRPASPLRL
jgi:hypothetical protein